MMLQEINSTLLSDGSHVADLYTRLKHRIEAKAKQASAESSELFRPFTTLRGIDTEFLVQHIVATSDLSVAEVLKARTVDDESTINLLCFDTQLPPTLKMLPPCMARPVLSRILAQRRSEVGAGGRLSTFKEKGGLLRSGGLNWKVMGCYTPTFAEDGSLKQVKHCSGDIINLEASPVTKRFDLVDNHLDYQASFVCKPMPPVRIHMFFKDTHTGPCRSPQITNTSKAWRELVSHCNEAWEQAKAAASAAKPQDEIATELVKQHTAEVKRDRATKARAVAKAVMADGKRRRTISMTS